MFIVTINPVARPSSVGAARTGILSPINLRQRPDQHAFVPLLAELGATCGTCGYNHDAPSGAFHIATSAPPLRERCMQATPVLVICVFRA